MAKPAANQVKEPAAPEYRAEDPQQAWTAFQAIARKALTTPKPEVAGKGKAKRRQHKD